MLRIKALGSLSVLVDGTPVTGAAAQPRRLGMLVLLAQAGERGINRDKMVSLFWPDVDEEKARRSLANALSALRRDLGDDLFIGTFQLRLNPEQASADVLDFRSALAAGRLEDAVALHAGPFLDGFRLPGLGEFDRWSETERAALTHQYHDALERLARSATERGEPAVAAGWWRKLAAQDPLNARFAIGLMQALTDAGDRPGALRHAQIHEALVEQELELPPDREVVELARRLREAPPPARAAGPVSPRRPAPLPDREQTALHPSPGIPPSGLERALPQARPAFRRRAALLLAAVVLLGGAGLALRWLRHGGGSSPPPTPVIALGRINDHRLDRSIELTLPLSDMLGTGLARAPGLEVVSTARMYELLAQVSPTRDTSDAAMAAAARRAGATQLLRGALYSRDGQLRLDLQAVDLSTGIVRVAPSVQAADVFALADSGIVRLLDELGRQVPSGSVADFTTRSLPAYRFYEEGLRAYYQGDLRGAERLFGAALAEDSTFALAAFYQFQSVLPDENRVVLPLFERANRLAVNAPERERLTIQAYWALFISSASAAQIAETLAVRYPHEPQGHMLLGLARKLEGRYLDAIPFFERVVAMDSLSLAGRAPRCQACDALNQLAGIYEHADSLDRAERIARRWIRLQPESGPAWGRLAWVLSLQGRIDEALAASEQRIRFGALESLNAEQLALLNLHGERVEAADELLRGLLVSGTADRRASARWFLTVSLRMQGRLNEALVEAREQHRLYRQLRPENALQEGGLQEAQVLFELGRYAEAHRIFDRFARWRPASETDPRLALLSRNVSWGWTHAATTLAAAGDTVALAPLVDSLRIAGSQTGYHGNRILHHYARGLLLAARGQDQVAIREFRQAVDSWNVGYTRVNYELAKALIRQGRAREAVPVLQAALRGTVETRNLYITRTELHELLAQAWEAAGGPGTGDSAVAHYRRVATLWQHADPLLQPRRAAAERAIARLVSGSGR